MKDEEFQLDSAESKNTLLSNMFTGTALFISFLLSLSCTIWSLPVRFSLEVADVEQLGAQATQPHVEPVPPVCRVILIPFVFTTFVMRYLVLLHFVPPLFGSSLPFLRPRSCLLCGDFLLCTCLPDLGLFLQTHACCVSCVTCAWADVCLCFSLYSPLMYSATYIFPFQVLQVLLASQTLGTCSWACRVWMGILTKGHKSEPMYSHR